MRSPPALLCRARRLAFDAWIEGVLVQRDRTSKVNRAVSFFAQSTLAAAWNGWHAAVARKQDNQHKVCNLDLIIAVHFREVTQEMELAKKLVLPSSAIFFVFQQLTVAFASSMQ